MQVRPIEPTDVEAVCQVWNAAMSAQGQGYGKHTLDPKRVESFMADEVFAPEASTVALDGEDILGVCFGYPAKRDDGLVGRLAGIAVDPAVQREGIGSALLAAVEEALAAAGATRMYYHINRQSHQFTRFYLDTGPYRFLQAAGYRPTHHAVRLRNDLADFELPAEIAERRDALAAEDITIGRVERDEREALLEFMEPHFPGGWENAVRRATRDFSDTEVMVAKDGDTIIGFHGPHQVDEASGRGRFGCPGVNPEYRGRGIGKTLIYLGLENLTRMGATYTDYRTGYQRPDMSASTEIYWDSNARLVEVIGKIAEKEL